MCSAYMGYSKSQTIHACFQGPVDSKNGSFEISNGEVDARWEDI